MEEDSKRRRPASDSIHWNQDQDRLDPFAISKLIREETSRRLGDATSRLPPPMAAWKAQLNSLASSKLDSFLGAGKERDSFGRSQLSGFLAFSI